MTIESLTEIYEKFCNLSLSRAEWTHEAHLWVAAVAILEKGKTEALEFLQQQIPQYNMVTGVENTTSSGYHETLTCFYIFQMGAYLQENQIADLTTLANSDLINNEIANRDFPFLFYDKETLFSVTARQSYIAPTKKPSTQG